MNRIKLSTRNDKEQREHGVVAVNCGLVEKENCILLYSSFSYKYPNAVKKLVEFIKRTDYVGHLIY